MSTDVLVVVGVGGMGESLARRLGAGKQVLLADFSEEALDRLASVMQGEGYAVSTRKVDVSSHESVAALADAAAELGAVKHVVHTAGLSPAQASAEAILRVDLTGVAHSLEEFGRVIAPGGSGVVIASMAGTMAAGAFTADQERELALTPVDKLLDLPFLQPEGVPHASAAYGLSKRANQLRVQAASIEWGKRGARVNSISPGVISTPMGQLELASETGWVMRNMIDTSGTGRIGTPSDVSNAAAFLLGPDATFITGADLLIDGGVIAAIHAGVLVIPTE